MRPPSQSINQFIHPSPLTLFCSSIKKIITAVTFCGYYEVKWVNMCKALRSAKRYSIAAVVVTKFHQIQNFAPDPSRYDLNSPHFISFCYQNLERQSWKRKVSKRTSPWNICKNPQHLLNSKHMFTSRLHCHSRLDTTLKGLTILQYSQVVLGYASHRYVKVQTFMPLISLSQSTFLNTTQTVLAILSFPTKSALIKMNALTTSFEIEP